MGTLLKLIQGGESFNLWDGVRFQLNQDFVPASLDVGGRRPGLVFNPDEYPDRPLVFSLNVIGSSDAELKGSVNALERFLARAGNRAAPLYLAWKSNDAVTVLPLFGQDGWLYYEVAAGAVRLTDRYLVGANLSADISVVLSLTVRGVALGTPHRLATGKGGLAADYLGTLDGHSRGLITGEATVNLLDNPFFGHATYDTGHTAGANVTKSINIDKRFLLKGQRASAKLTARGTSAAPANSLYQAKTLAASSHTIWAIIALPDGGTPSSSDCQIHYNGSDLTTTFTQIGSSIFWYAEATQTGTGGSANVGITVKAGRTIYLCFVQAEAKAYRSYMCHGDMLGCSWSGTPHAASSTSTRAVGSVRVPVAADTFEIGGFTFALAIKMAVANTHPNDMQLVRGGSSSIRARFNSSGDTITWQDGTNTATSAAISFAKDAIVVFHFAASPAGLVAYKDGVAIANSGGLYTPPTLPSHFYVGSTETPDLNVLGTIMAFLIFPKALDATA